MVAEPPLLELDELDAAGAEELELELELLLEPQAATASAAATVKATALMRRVLRVKVISFIRGTPQSLRKPAHRC